ncbi:MAG: hypothetical protein GC149_08840 [Gammaproteobacteria bacterium]|nr:hypothetical protein [Gammaproteobacteria bacterium]
MSVKHNTILLCVALASTLSLPLAQAASSGGTIKCWRNDLGIRECGNVVPPEYSQRRIEVLNDRGLVIDVIEPPKTKEQLEKEREQAQLHKAEEAARKEQERRDAILLNSYTTERDLIIARDTNIKAAQGQLDIAEGNLKLLQNSLADLENRAGNYERSGGKPPKKLIDEIEKTKQQIADKEKVIEKRKEEKAVMEQRFNKDLARFRKLKGIKD